MKCPGIMPRVAFDSIFPPARRTHWWFMKWSLRSFIYSFVFFGALFFPSSSVSGACSWNGLFLWSLLEGNPRKFGVVVVAAELTSSASPYSSFIYAPFFLGRHTHFLTQACRNQASSTAPIFSSLLERDLRKSGVVALAAKLTSSTSPYPFSFIVHRFIQHAYVPIHHSTPIPVYLHHA